MQLSYISTTKLCNS